MLDVHIPKLIIQPLIENSIVHGFLKHDRDYSTFIEGSCEDELCNISIKDNGEGMTEEKLGQLQKLLYLRGAEAEESDFLGLRNIIERLQLHYGDALKISMNSSPAEGMVISFSFPAN